MIENKTVADYSSETSFYDNCINCYYDCEPVTECINCDFDKEVEENDIVSESSFYDRCTNGEYGLVNDF